MDLSVLLPFTLRRPAAALPVRQLTDYFMEVWWSLPGEPPDLGQEYTLQQQRDNEKRFENALADIQNEFKTPAASQPDRVARQTRIASLAEDFARITFNVAEADIQAIKAYGFLQAAIEFSRQARSFDGLLVEADILQASRNLWSMNLMQIMFGLPVQVTPAALAYSLLYPYTDNYLDDPDCSRSLKRSFNERLYRRLLGEIIEPLNRPERMICELVARIEAQYERHAWPQIYASLLAIHSAQGHSMLLQSPQASPYEMDVLGLCFEKGGTSTLADGYLVAGDLSPEQQLLTFHYGTFTQLVDDLEDVQADLLGGIQTVFSQTAGKWPLDRVTQRTIHFGNQFVDQLERLPVVGLEPLKRLLRRAIPPMIVAEAGAAGCYYSHGYLKELQAHFPFRFAFLQKQRRNLKHHQISPLQVLLAFEAVL